MSISVSVRASSIEGTPGTLSESRSESGPPGLSRMTHDAMLRACVLG